MMHVARFALLLASVSALVACRDDLNAAEARQAIEEATISSDASGLTGASVEIATDFTLGQGVQAAAEEVRSFITSQLPCAAVTLADATLTIEYGANPGSCTYRGQTFSGSHAITLAKTDDEVVVDHTWTKLSNGRVEVTGSAHVVWSQSQASRTIEHTLTWTRLADGRTGEGSGSRTQTALAGGVQEGIAVDGQRTWDGQAGSWELAIDDVELRWQDPVPQAGSYVLTTPDDKTLEMSFARVDEDTIAVSIEGTRRNFDFLVSKSGEVSER